MGLTVVLWNYDSRDWSWDGISNITTLVRGLTTSFSLQNRTHAGKIILKHDMKNTTVFLAPYFLNATMNARMNIVPIATCLGDTSAYAPYVVPPSSWNTLPPSSWNTLPPSDPPSNGDGGIDPIYTTMIDPNVSGAKAVNSLTFLELIFTFLAFSAT